MMDIQAFFRITYGLYIVSSCDRNGRKNGHISNTVFQITAEPPMFAIASHKENLTTKYIEESGVFSVSVIRKEANMDFIGPWGFHSGREMDKFEGIEHKTGITGAPIVLKNALAYLDCRVKQTINTGTHILFIGEVVDAALPDPEASPLTYTWYREVIKGISPEKAPTYINKEKLNSKFTDTETNIEMEKSLKYRCMVCGYVYNPEEGDPSKGIPAGTTFEDLPEDWTCPVCGVGKNEFRTEE